MWYKIKEGRHRAYPLSLGIHFGKTSESYEVIFDDSCRYILEGEDSQDWNKLVGWSYGLHHKNSIRIGWRYNSKEDKIEVSPYLYSSGRRTSLDKGHLLSFGKSYTFRIKNEYTDKGFYDSIELDGKIIYTGASLIKPKWGYNLGCYFGGNNPTPHDMKIWMRKL